jgi:hypothetical protein
MGKFDLSRGTNSIAAKLECFFPTMASMTLPQLKETLLNVLNDESTSVSEHTKKFWINKMEKKNTTTQMMLMLTNLYLGGANLHIPGSK